MRAPAMARCNWRRTYSTSGSSGTRHRDAGAGGVALDVGARRMKEYGLVRRQAIERDRDDVVRPHQPRRRAADDARALQPETVEPLVQQREALAAVIDLEVLAPDRAPVLAKHQRLWQAIAHA